VIDQQRERGGGLEKEETKAMGWFHGWWLWGWDGLLVDTNLLLA
jgi:hypothetical protein